MLTALLLGGSGDFETVLLSNGDKVFKEVVTDKATQKKLFSELKPVRKSLEERHSKIEEALQEMSKLSLEFADQSSAMKTQSALIIKEYKAGQEDMIKAWMIVSKNLPDSVWNLFSEAYQGLYDETETPAFDETLSDNFQVMDELIDQYIRDEQRKSRANASRDIFKANIEKTLDQLMNRPPSSSEVYLVKESDKISLQKPYYPVNSSLTQTLNASIDFYAKTKSMCIKSEWDGLAPAYKGKAKGK